MASLGALETYRRTAAIALPFALLFLAVLLVRPPPPPAQRLKGSLPPKPLVEVFTNVYEAARWGTNEAGVPNSGPGSTVERTVVYRAYLQNFLKEHDIHSVVDAGCGDWEFSRLIDWSGVDYKGYDVVESIVERDRELYAAPDRQFFVADILETDLPPADLLIVKHVLQHLPNRDVARFLKQLPKYQHAILVDGVDSYALTASNVDIVAGQYRPLDPTQPPFNLGARKDLLYWDGLDMHEVLHVQRGP
jgi:SAM-dependent methyltransferase